MSRRAWRDRYFHACAQEHGLDCMHFNPHVYHDLLRCGDGSAEGLITAFFDVVRASFTSGTVGAAAALPSRTAPTTLGYICAAELRRNSHVHPCCQRTQQGQCMCPEVLCAAWHARPALAMRCMQPGPGRRRLPWADCRWDGR
jgi:hypothetical protein